MRLVVGQRVIGAITFSAAAPRKFSDSERRLIRSMGDLAGAAIERSRLYDEQVKVAEQLREADEIKSRFLASMSHELRTPLNAILNFTKFVSTGTLGPINDKQEDALNKTVQSGRHLLNLINDVLDVTKIESNMLNLFVEEDVDLRDELDTVAASGESLLTEKSAEVKLVCDIDPNLPKIIGDRRRIRQILLNLVSNACKFTEHGQVVISAQVRDGNVMLYVRDTGPGIAEEEQAIIFEPFRQARHGVNHGGGTGLGLAIARRLAEAHGGQLWVESKAGEGSSFYVTLPVQSEALRAQIPTKIGA
jgi:signal transduction histidine kinase